MVKQCGPQHDLKKLKDNDWGDWKWNAELLETDVAANHEFPEYGFAVEGLSDSDFGDRIDRAILA